MASRARRCPTGIMRLLLRPPTDLRGSSCGMRLSGGRRYRRDYDALPDAACNVPLPGMHGKYGERKFWHWQKNKVCQCQIAIHAVAWKKPCRGTCFFSSSGNKPPLRTYAPLRRWDTMKKYEAPVVHCEYAVAAESLAQLLEEAFRLYLAHILALEKRHAVNCAR